LLSGFVVLFFALFIVSGLVHLHLETGAEGLPYPLGGEPLGRPPPLLARLGPVVIGRLEANLFGRPAVSCP
jgi:hypothetical protein